MKILVTVPFQKEHQEELKKETLAIEERYNFQQKLKEKEWEENERKRLQEKEKEINELDKDISRMEREIAKIK